jgi:hypothetical protein
MRPGCPQTADQSQGTTAPDVPLLLGDYSRMPDELWRAIDDEDLPKRPRRADECVARCFLGPDEMYQQQGLPSSAGELQAEMGWPHRTTADRALHALKDLGLRTRRPNPAQRNGYQRPGPHGATGPESRTLDGTKADSATCGVCLVLEPSSEVHVDLLVATDPHPNRPKR